jgi:cystathionine beta-lyase/cystathionine gamma-synthase
MNTDSSNKSSKPPGGSACGRPATAGVPHMETVIAHSGLAKAREGEAVPAVPPIFPSVGFLHHRLGDVDQALGYAGGTTPVAPGSFVYSRHGSPNQADLEEAIAALEGAEGAVCFSSGMAALHASVLTLVPPGGSIVAAAQVYGVTRTMLDMLSASMGLRVHYADFLDVDSLGAAVEEARPACVLCEVLTNPLSRLVPLDRVADIARQAKASLLVDNTFATPFLLRPLDYGADIVVHSSTKFINGHGDVLGGVAAGSAGAMRCVYQYRRVLGSVPSPFDAWLTLRGLRTLALRMERASSSALHIARWLRGQNGVIRVYYPGLEDDPGFDAACRLFRHGCYGSMLAFEIGGLDRAGAFAFVERLRLIRPVTSLGDVYTLIMHPASASHRALTAEQREAQGITEGVLRLSVGIEHSQDLVEDLHQALQIRS